MSNTQTANRKKKERKFSNTVGSGGGCTPKNLGWGGFAARFSKSLPYFTPKDVIFHTRFQT